jgi:hypothetical protein
MLRRSIGMRARSFLLGALYGFFWFSIEQAEYFRGFPDSHFTDYDRAVALPENIVANACLVGGLLLFGLAARGGKLLSGKTLAVFATILLLLIGLEYFGFNWYFHVHLGLDSGQGG